MKYSKSDKQRAYLKELFGCALIGPSYRYMFLTS